MKKKLNRKASLGPEAIAALVLLLAFVVFALLFQSQAITKSGEKRDLDRCRNSAAMYHLSKAGSADISLIREMAMKQTKEGSDIDLDCPIVYKTISNADDKQIMKALADQMAGCYYKFLEGNINLFSKTIGEQTNYCVICSDITFKDEAKNRKIGDFTGYLMANKIPKMFVDDKTYFEYLTGIYSGKDFVKELEEKVPGIRLPDEIDTSNDYFVIFLYPKYGYKDKLDSMKEGSVIGTAVGGAAAAGISIATKGVSLKLSSMIIGIGSGAGALIGYNLGDEKSFDWSAKTLLVPKDPEMLKLLECQTPVPLGFRP